MYHGLSEIDDLTRPDHSFIDVEDRCFYLGEYTAKAGYAYSPTNQLILNLKKGVHKRGNPEFKYKVRAIRNIADNLRTILTQRNIEKVTFVPVPPSKARNDPSYDDRLVKILTRMCRSCDADVRELVLQRESRPADHSNNDRSTIQELIANYYIEEISAGSVRPIIFVFDDLLTTGRHFKAMQSKISDCFPDSLVYGLFVARRIPNTDDVENLQLPSDY